jgi:GNAT superfamily N-acetyltransferase
MNAAIEAGARHLRYPSALIDRLTLADGRQVIVRPVMAIDAPAQQDFVRALSLESRRKRFHFPLKELSPTVLRQLTDVDHVGHVAIVAEAFADDEDEDEATIVADARYVREGDETHFAITVADAWQGIGLGRALMQRLLRYAARRGVVRLVADMLPGNTAMLQLAASFGGRRAASSPHGPGVTRVVLDLGHLPVSRPSELTTVCPCA